MNASQKEKNGSLNVKGQSAAAMARSALRLVAVLEFTRYREHHKLSFEDAARLVIARHKDAMEFSERSLARWVDAFNKSGAKGLQERKAGRVGRKRKVVS